MTVYLNGSELAPYHGRYDIRTIGVCEIRAVDVAGNEESVTVYVKDTHTYERGNPASVIWQWDENTEAHLTLVCVHCGHSVMPAVSVSKTSANTYDIYTATAIGDDGNTYTDTKTAAAPEPSVPATVIPQITFSPEPSVSATVFPQITLAPEATPVWEDELWFDGEYYSAEEVPDQAEFFVSGELSSPGPSASPEPGPEPEEENSIALVLPPKGNLIIKTGNARESEGPVQEQKQERGSDAELREANLRTLKCLALVLAICICFIIIIKINIPGKTQKKSKNRQKTID